MLGNFSFGDYFKADAIELGVGVADAALDIDPKRLVVTVFGGDASLKLGPGRRSARAVEEGHRLRRRPHHRARHEGQLLDDGRHRPAWGRARRSTTTSTATGRRGRPTEPASTARAGSRSGTWCSCSSSEAPRTRRWRPLPKPSIDTGAGLERVTAVVQGVRSNYDTDLFRSLLEQIAERAPRRTIGRSDADDDVSMRVIADHARATAFLIADGVLPSNEGRGYVLRRIMRRAIRHGVRLGLAERHLPDRLLARDRRRWATPIPSCASARGLIEKVVARRGRGVPRARSIAACALLDERVRQARAGGATLPGETVFKLYDTYGFPADLTRVIAEERGFGVDEAGFDAEMDKQRARGEFAGSGEAGVADVLQGARGQARRDEVPRLRDATAASGTIVVVLRRAASSTARARGRDRRRPDAVLRRVGRPDRRHRHDRERRARGRRDRHAQDAGRAACVHLGAVVPRPARASATRATLHRRRRAPRRASAPTTRRRTCCTWRSKRCSARTWRRRARWSRPIGCASTSRTSRR